MRINALFNFIFSFFVIIVVANSSTAQLADDQVRISEIRVDGNSRVAPGTVQTYLPVRVGDLTTPSALSNALERLYETNLFQNIKLDLEGSVLTVSVTENPIINRVNIEGNDVISDERLLDVINVQQRRVYTRKVAIDATRQLIDVYRASGRFAAVVEPKIIELDNNRVDLVFEVNEGPLIKIDSISFSGNASFSDRKLKQVIASREKRWWAFLSASDKYDEGRLDYDIRLLRQFYLARGYADINVQRARGGLLPDRSGFAITFLVNEGVRYQVNEISLVSEIKGVDINELRQLVSFDDDAWYDARLLEQGLLDISKRLGSFGYAFVNVTPDIKTNAGTAKLDIDIKIEKSRRNFVERIEFVDNSRTTDRVLRREFEIVEGDAYNQLKIDRSIRNVRNLGYFSEVKVQTLRGSTPEQSVTSVTVREQPTGDFSIGVGYSSLNQANFTLGINERNFLGTGRRLKMAFSTSGEDTDFTIGLTEPYFMGRDLTGSFDVFNNNYTDSSADQRIKSFGFSSSAGFSSANDFAHNISYTLQNVETEILDSQENKISSDGGKLSSSLGYQITKDTRDNRFNPSSGYNYRISEQYAGLGGDLNYISSVISGGYYYGFDYTDIVIGLNAEYGIIDGIGENISQSNRFYLGGRKVRGFDASGIGPRAAESATASAVGGNNYYAGRVAIRSGIAMPKDTGIKWTIFTDFGSLWGIDETIDNYAVSTDKQSIRISAGYGFLWETPIGPLTFTWADALKKETYDQLRRFEFRIGSIF